MSKLVEAEVAKVVISQVTEGQLVWLREKGKGEKGRRFVIVIGIFEALAMRRAMMGEVPPRPQTHELIYRIIDGLNARVERVTVSDLRDNTFYAVLTLRVGDKTVEIDARPSDALTIAVHYKVPVFVSEKVFREAAE